jgi:prolyl-tRNA synthetase
MRQSQLFAKTKKEIPKEAQALSHRLLLKGDFIEQIAAGIYAFLPLGWRVHQKIEQQIRKAMVAIGGQEVYLPALIPRTLWEKTKRWQTIDPPLFKLKDRHQTEFGLGSTHEEVIVDLASHRIKSYKDLPLFLFQIQDKFRNEMRSTGGLLRVREFIMKDLYSFHASKEDAISYYQKVKKAYFQIFKNLNLDAVCVEADPGTIGGELSHEFMVLSETGEDKVLICKKCNFAGNVEKFKTIKTCPKCKASLEKFSSIEAAHAFYLGTKYSKVMGANFVDKSGKSQPIIMGCYGIGLGRLLATVVEVNHDQQGIIWPEKIAPFLIHLINLQPQLSKVKKVSEKLYRDLIKRKIEVLYDDRQDKTPGEKLIDADLIGIPQRLIISERTLKKNCAEIKKRKEKKPKLIKLQEIKTKI